MSVSALSAYYGAKQVIREVSLEVPQRECVALVGESGSGKTTLARCLIGLHTGYTGQVSFEGSALSPGIRARTDRVAQRMQFIFQNPYSSLNPRKTVAQIVAQPLGRFYRIPPIETQRRSEAALREVSLDPATYLPKFPGELSGGEAQRVAIARALIVEPVLLICDEVTSSLDASVQAIIVELLRSLQAKRGLSMIFITHNLALVRSIAQTVLVLQDGSVVEYGAVSDVLTHPLAPYTAQLLEDAPRLDAVGL
jgi:peptide/nickel transport system ATP-binding protein